MSKSEHSASRLSVAQPELDRFFTSIHHRVKLAEARQRRIDKRWATQFNVFDLIEPDENEVSDILADLLNPKESHGQGDLFLRLLFKQVGLGFDAKLSNKAKVQREAPTHGIQKYRRRMDVLVEAGGAVLVIENKLDSLEQRDQVKDYLQHLEHHSRGRPTKLIYLTPDGRAPESPHLSEIERQIKIGKLHCWSYRRELRVWLASCRRVCEAQKIRHFLSDFDEFARHRESDNNPQDEINDD